MPHLYGIFNQRDFDDDSDDLLTFVVCGGQWENVVRLWKELFKRCAESKVPASDDELALLNNCIALYNHTSMSDKKVMLDSSNVGDDYDYNRHHLVGVGDTIRQVLLPALVGANASSRFNAVVLCS